MKKYLAAALAVTGLLAAPAIASAAVLTGTITITGSVASKCSVSGSLDASQDLGELSAADSTLVTTLSGTNSASPAFTKNFTVDCTGANAGVSVTSTALANTGVATAPTGYTRAINYTGRASLDLVTNPTGSLTLDVPDDSAVAGASTANFGAANFLANTANNVRVSAYGFNTAVGASLVAGSYSGTIVVTITP